MLNRKRFSPLAYLLLIIVLMMTLAACSGDGEAIPVPDSNETAVVPQPTKQADETAETPVPATPAPGAVPYTLRVQAVDPALDPTCLEASAGFELRSAAIPASGLEQGRSLSSAPWARPPDLKSPLPSLAPKVSNTFTARPAKIGTGSGSPAWPRDFPPWT